MFRNLNGQIMTLLAKIYASNDRVALDRRNLVHYLFFVEEKILTMKNDSNLKPISRLFSELHSNFRESYELFKNVMYDDMNIKQIKEKIADSSVKMSKTVEMFEGSGNSDSNCMNTEENGYKVQWLITTTVVSIVIYTLTTIKQGS